jgi:hypothetical protein
MKPSSRARLTSEALALFDEVTTSSTSWSDPRYIDTLTRDVLLHALELEDRVTARRVLRLALAAADDSAVAEAVMLLRDDRDRMLSSLADEYRTELERWQAAEPKPPAPAVLTARARRRAS